MLGMVGRIDTIEKIAEVTPNVAGLSEPHHSTARDFTAGRADEF
jgi:hypothetical protein